MIPHARTEQEENEAQDEQEDIYDFDNPEYDIINNYDLKVGDKIEIQPCYLTDNLLLIGIIGEITTTAFYVFSTTHDGISNIIKPPTGLKSWSIQRYDANLSLRKLEPINVRILNKTLCETSKQAIK